MFLLLLSTTTFCSTKISGVEQELHSLKDLDHPNLVRYVDMSSSCDMDIITTKVCLCKLVQKPLYVSLTFRSSLNMFKVSPCPECSVRNVHFPML